MDFLAFDFETANHNKSSVCALGIVVVENGSIAHEKHYYINPEEEFEDFNIHIHKITEDMVKDAPTFPKVWEEVKPLFCKYPLVAHNMKSADMAMLRAACNKNEIPLPKFKELYDTMVIAQDNLALKNNKLKTVADYFHISLEDHHDPLCDARATAFIMQSFLDAQIYVINPLYHYTPYTFRHSPSTSFARFSDTNNNYKENSDSTKQNISGISGFVTPNEFTAFDGEYEKAVYLKSVGLLSQNPKFNKQFIYNGAYAESACLCEIIGYGDYDTVVISLDGHPHIINLDCLKEMQPAKSSDLYSIATSTIPIYTEGVYEYLKKARNVFFHSSPYNEIVKINLNSSRDCSFTFCNQNAFFVNFAKQRNMYKICVKDDLFKIIATDNKMPVQYETDKIDSLTNYTRIFIEHDILILQQFVDYIFQFMEKYVDKRYIPDRTFDCCHRYMECSDMKKCTCPDYLYSKSCTYRKKLEKGIIFFGNNRNVE